jgi:hypothetical protein
MTKNFGKNACKPGKEHKNGAIVIPIETEQSLIHGDIDDYYRTMVVEVLMKMMSEFFMNFIHTFRFSVLLLNELFFFERYCV